MSPAMWGLLAIAVALVVSVGVGLLIGRAMRSRDLAPARAERFRLDDLSRVDPPDLDPVDAHFNTVIAGSDLDRCIPVNRLAPHDVLPEVDDEWRTIAAEYLERMFAAPAAERAS